VVAGALKLPGTLQAGDGVGAGDLFAGVQVEGPGLGDQLVLDDQRAYAVPQGLGPQERAVISGQGNSGAGCVLTPEELGPVVAIAVGRAEDQDAPAGHAGEHVGGASGEVHGGLPDRFAGAQVKGVRHSNVHVSKLLEGLVGCHAFALEFRDLGRESLGTLVVGGGLVGKEDAAGVHGDGVIADVFALMDPEHIAGLGVHGKEHVAVLALGGTAADENAVGDGYVLPSAALLVHFRNGIGAQRLAGLLVETQALVADGDEEAAVIAGEIAALADHAHPHCAGDLPLPV